jgi:hypothetical protein
VILGFSFDLASNRNYSFAPFMFIKSGPWIRKNARWLFVGILVVLVPGFVMLFTHTPEKPREAQLPKIGGKPVSLAEFQHHQLATAVDFLLTTGREIPRTAEGDAFWEQQTVVRILLLRKARQMRLDVSDEQVVETIQKMPLFQTEGRFDSNRYRGFLAYLSQRRIPEAFLEETVRDNLLIRRLRDIISSAAKVTPLEVRHAYEPLHEKHLVSLVHITTNDVPPHAVTDEQVRAFFERNPQAFRLPAQIKVRYAIFHADKLAETLTIADADIARYYEQTKNLYLDAQGEPKPLDDVRAEVEKSLRNQRALRLAGDRAVEFSIKMLPEPGKPAPDFAAVAAEFGAEVRETDHFTAAAAPEIFPGGDAFVKTAFTLSAENPVSDPILSADGYVVLGFVERRAARTPTFDEAKERATEQLQAFAHVAAAVERARAALADARRKMAEGATFADACRDLNLKIVELPAFTLVEPLADWSEDEAEMIKTAAAHVATGQVSELFPTASGASFLYVRERLPMDETQFEREKEEFARRLLLRNRDAIFNDWVNELWRTANVQLPRQSAPQTQSGR